MRALIDNDVTLDHFLQRPPFATEAKEIFERMARKQFEGYLASITFNNIFYIVRKARGRDIAFQTVEKLLKIVNVCAATKSILENAAALDFKDYEDAIQHACAEAENLDVIVTRNLSDYKNATIPVYSPADFLNLLKTP